MWVLYFFLAETSTNLVKSGNVHVLLIHWQKNFRYLNFHSWFVKFFVNSSDWTIMAFMMASTTHALNFLVTSQSSTMQLRHFTPQAIWATPMTCDRRLFGQHLPGSREHHAMIAFLSTVTTSLAACVGWKSHEPYAFFLSLFTTLLIRVL